MSEELMQSTLYTALNILKQGDIIKAYSELEKILRDNLENLELDYALKAVRFWVDCIEKIKNSSTYIDQGEYLISQWRPFLNYINKQGNHNEAILYALRHAVFSLALDFYAEVFKTESSLPDAEPYRKVGLCYKALGDYKKALEFLRYASELDKNSPAILAELADCYALYGEIKFSKAFFREAFFINPDGIELQFLESEIIGRLIRRVQKIGYKKNDIVEWVPVYGVIDGVFNVTRELRAFEFGQLKQKIFSLESEIQNKPKEQTTKLVPRLINYYFWLIDHYININENKAKIDDVLLKVKVLDQTIYNCYVK